MGGWDFQLGVKKHMYCVAKLASIFVQLLEYTVQNYTTLLASNMCSLTSKTHVTVLANKHTCLLSRVAAGFRGAGSLEEMSASLVLVMKVAFPC